MKLSKLLFTALVLAGCSADKPPSSNDLRMPVHSVGQDGKPVPIQSEDWYVIVGNDQALPAGNEGECRQAISKMAHAACKQGKNLRALESFADPR